MADATRHDLVPKHEILSDEEKKKLLVKYGTKAENLPEIHASDAGIKHLGAKAGDVIRITRKSHTAGTAFYFRAVVDK